MAFFEKEYALTALSQPSPRRITLFSGRRGRVVRENILAYLFILPAVTIIGTFGIFPVAFALYVSLHKWQIKQGPFIGLDNYVNAISSLIYVAGFWLATGALVAAFLYARRLWRITRESNQGTWLWFLPGILSGVSILLAIRWLVLAVPGVLAIADKVRGVKKTREVFIKFLDEAFSKPEVLAARNLALFLLALTIGLLIAAYWWKRLTPARNGSSNRNYCSASHAAEYFGYTLTATLFAIAGPLVGWFTYREIVKSYATALQKGTPLSIWAQAGTISAGVLLLLLAWFIWRKAAGLHSMKATILRLTVATLLLVAGWALIGELPPVVASGSKVMWKGLQTTIWYSISTVPFELSIGMILAILLFQNIRGKSIYRVIFFLPYVTPSIASAAMFRVFFANRVSAPMNSLLNIFGIAPFQFLAEPTGVFQVLATRLCIGDLPPWMGGPSLALVVICLFNIWTFVGYNTVIYLAGLGTIPRELYEVAEVDGAGRWAIFRHITFPLLSPTTYFLTLLATIGTFKAFNHIWVLRESAALGTTDTFSVVIFQEFFRNTRYGYASALAFVLFAIILTLTLINNRIAKERVFYG